MYMYTLRNEFCIPRHAVRPPRDVVRHFGSFICSNRPREKIGCGGDSSSGSSSESYGAVRNSAQ
jgi:hypothetical protein